VSVSTFTGDCRELLATLAPESVQTCVTSPPYFGLRDYGVTGQLGMEKHWPDYVEAIVDVFAAVHRVLREDGTLWLNLGDSYATGGGSVGRAPGGGDQGARFIRQGHIGRQANRMPQPGLKSKDLMGIPWRVAFALQADGWYLRSDIIWHKPNPMPESVTDRPTKAHEYLFLLAKSERYYYDAAAIREPLAPASLTRLSQDVDAQEGSYRVPGKTNGPMKAVRRSGNKERKYGEDRDRPGSHMGASVPWSDDGSGRNRRTVWTVATQPFKGAHFATFPPALIDPCILAGSRRGDTVLDPFGGAGTTGLVADRLGRDAVLIELNPTYAEMARERITGDAPLFAGGAA
jgi:DNA modification methylase